MNQSPLLARVARKHPEARDICTFELVSADGLPLPPFSAGSHIDVHIADGLTRQYSLCNNPSETHRYVIGVLRDANSRGGSVAMHDVVQEGDIIAISRPKNFFPLNESAGRSLLFAGGIGATPILSMAERLSDLDAEFHMHMCARSMDRMPFVDRVGASAFSQRVRLHYDDGADEQKLDLTGLLRDAHEDTHLYVCGPSGFIKFVTESARSYGWGDARIHVEYFSAEVAPKMSDGSFEVQIASTGRVLSIPPDRTVLAVLNEAGVALDSSCNQGTCGTCLTRVLEGIPDHRDVIMTEHEHSLNDHFTPCCSRSLSPRLVLDL